jgi:hypothetical protein
MRFFKTTFENEVNVSGLGVLMSFVPEPGIVYFVCSGEGAEGWTEVTQADYIAVGGVLPPESAPTLADKVDALGVMMVQLMLGGS